MACDPQTLAAQSSCFFCLPPGYYYPIKLAILARWLKALSPGADTSVAGLLADPAAACVACPPGAQLGPLKLALICTATTGGGPAPPIPPSNLTIDLGSSGSDVHTVWTNNGGATSIELWKSVNFGPSALYATLAGAAVDYHDPANMAPLDYWEYKIRAVNGVGNSAFTTPAGAALGIVDNASAVISYPNLIISFDTIDLRNNAALTALSMPRLQRVDLDFLFSGCPNLASASISALQRVDHSFQGFNNSSLATALSLPALTIVGADFTFSNCGVLPTISLPVLASLGNTFDVSANTNLAVLSVPSLIVAPNSILAPNCSRLSSVNFSNLQTVVGNIDFTGAAVLANLSLSFPNLITVGGNFLTLGCTLLTSISAPALQTIGGNVRLSSNPFFSPALVSVNFSALTTVGVVFSVIGAPLTTLSIAALQTVGSEFHIESTALAAITLTSLTATGTLLLGDDFNIQNNTLATTLSTPVLATIDQSLGIGGNGFTSLSFPVFNAAADCNVINNPSLTSISFGLMNGGNTFANGAIFSGNAIVTVTAPNMLFPDNGQNVDFQNNAMNQASVDLVLHRLVLSAVTSLIVNLDLGTNSPPSLPCINPLSDCFALNAAGNSVTTN